MASVFLCSVLDRILKLSADVHPVVFAVCQVRISYPSVRIINIGNLAFGVVGKVYQSIANQYAWYPRCLK